MTQSDAIERVSRWLDKGKQHEDNQLGYVEGWFTKEDEQAFSMALNALMSDPCEDAISRQAAINAVDALYLDGESAQGFTADANGDCLIGKNKAIEILDELPSVQLEPKTGHWRAVYQGDEIIDYRCTECEFGNTFGRNTYRMNYCPNCGAKMKGTKDEFQHD